MRKQIQYLSLIVCSVFVFAIVGCTKFLNVEPSTTSVNPTTIKDFKEMLNSDSLGTCNTLLLDLMSDDAHLSDYTLLGQDTYYLRTYLWKSTIWNPSDGDLMYIQAYARILQMNIILSRIGQAPLDSLNTNQNRNEIISQALMNRAWYYFLLVNAYGPAYNASSAATDLAVPEVTTPVSNTLPSRASVKSIYQLIVGDLRTALLDSTLPAMGVDILHPGKAAGYGLLSRTYLYMNRYDSALIYADSTLALKNSLQNYASYTNPSQLTDLIVNPEVIWAHLSTDVNFYSLYRSSIEMSGSLYDSLGYYDYRYLKKFSRGYYYTATPLGYVSLVMDNSLSTPEILLTKAECLARSGAYSEAGALIDQIRSNRMYSWAMLPRQYNASNILGYVLGERRRELFYHGGLRLFDLKRFNNEAALKQDLIRSNDALTSQLAILPAGSNRYLLPFTPTVIANNPNIIQNPRS